MEGPMDIWWVVADGGIMLLLPWLLHRHDVWSKCRLRLFAIIDGDSDDPLQVKHDLIEYLKDHRLNVEVKTVAMPFEKVFCMSEYDLQRRLHSRAALHTLLGVNKNMESILFNIHQNASRFLKASAEADSGQNTRKEPLTIDGGTQATKPRGNYDKLDDLFDEKRSKSADCIGTKKFADDLAQRIQNEKDKEEIEEAKKEEAEAKKT